MYTAIIVILATLVGLGLLATIAAHRSRRPRLALRSLVGGLLGVNGLIVLASIGLMLLSLAAPAPVLAQEGQAAADRGGVALGAALSTGLAAIGAGIAVGIAGAAAIGGITEKPEILGRTLIFVGLAEGIAIYGLIISFLILQQ